MYGTGIQTLPKEKRGQSHPPSGQGQTAPAAAARRPRSGLDGALATGPSSKCTASYDKNFYNERERTLCIHLDSVPIDDGDVSCPGVHGTKTRYGTRHVRANTKHARVTRQFETGCSATELNEKLAEYHFFLRPDSFVRRATSCDSDA
jgi:hypothetical protein